MFAGHLLGHLIVEVEESPGDALILVGDLRRGGRKTGLAFAELAGVVHADADAVRGGVVIEVIDAVARDVFEHVGIGNAGLKVTVVFGPRTLTLDLGVEIRALRKHLARRHDVVEGVVKFVAIAQAEGVIGSSAKEAGFVVGFLDNDGVAGKGNGLGLGNDVARTKKAKFPPTRPLRFIEIPTTAGKALQQIVRGPVGSPPMLAGDVQIAPFGVDDVAVVIQGIETFADDAIDLRLATDPDAKVVGRAITKLGGGDHRNLTAGDNLGKALDDLSGTVIRPRTALAIVGPDENGLGVRSGDHEISRGLNGRCSNRPQQQDQEISHR